MSEYLTYTTDNDLFTIDGQIEDIAIAVESSQITEDNFDDVTDSEIVGCGVTFFDWLEEKKTIDQDTLEETEVLPPVFQRAESKGKVTHQTLSEISLTSLQSVGSSLANLLGVFGPCGPLCAHGLGGLSSSLSQVSGAGGAFGSGLTFDSKGNFNLTGTVSDLAAKTGLSEAMLRSGQYSAEDILSRLFSTIGSGLYTCCFGLIDILIDCCIPTPEPKAA